MVEQGELKKRVKKYVEWKQTRFRNGEWTPSPEGVKLAYEIYEKTIDEAKKEFPCFKCPFLNTDNCHYCSGLYKQFLDFFLKWFGE